MGVTELSGYLKTHRGKLCSDLVLGKYLPQPILGVEIPKSNGKTRLLGIPTVIDRMLQQAVQQAQAYINEGYQHIVDIDLKNFFDEVDHCKLMQLLYNKVKCPITLRLIRKWLRAPILIKGKLVKRRKGVPQGSPLSPLLSNILLNELDKELERLGLLYVRYADDFSIYTKSKSAARKAGNTIYLFLRDKLSLPINREKSGIRRPVDFEILGFKFVPTYVKGEKGKYQLVVSDKSWKTLKQNLKTITRKTAPKSFTERVRQLKIIQQGWLNYFRMASILGKLREIDGWVRNRLRYCI